MAESKYSYGSHPNGQENNQDYLKDIEEHIKATGEQLKDLHSKMSLETDKLSENYLSMEEERKELRKKIIELDYEHKMMFAGNMRESRKQEQSRKEES